MTKTAITRNHAPSVSAALNKELAGCTDVGFIVRSHPNGVRVITTVNYAEDVMFALKRCGYGFTKMVPVNGPTIHYLITSRTR